MSETPHAIAAGHPVTAEAAQTILDAGGNAFDAAAAALATSFMAEPLLSSAGGGGFLLAHPAGGRDVLYDFFVQTPRARTSDAEDFHEARVDFGGTSQGYSIGWGSVATPGAVAGLFSFHRDLGRMPIQEVLAPALRAGREGVPVTPLQARILEVLAPIHQNSPETRELFSVGGRPLAIGDIHRIPDLADLLEVLAVEGVDLFYRGEVAARADALSRSGGGHLRRADFEGYAVVQREPLRLRYRGNEIWTNPPPASGGVLVGTGLHRMAEAWPSLRAAVGLDAMGPDLAVRLVRILAETDDLRQREGLDFPENLQRAARLLETHPRAFRGTTHLNILDAWGNGAALSISNGEGCGHGIAGTGIMLNNMLGEKDLQPRGLGAWPTDIRLTSMMAPTRILTADGREVLLGSGGSNRIRSALLRVILAILDQDFRLEDAVALPRLHVEANAVDMEGGWPEASVAALQGGPLEARVWSEPHLFFGGVHAVGRGVPSRGGQGALGWSAQGREGWEAAGDPRREGVGLVRG